MKYSDNPYPLLSMDSFGALKEAWERGWLDSFDKNHFLIRAIHGDLDNKYLGILQYKCNNVWMPETGYGQFDINFCMNFSMKLRGLMNFFGEHAIQQFIENQLSAGKENYNEAQFFRALSEVSVLTFWQMMSLSGEYEPHTNGKKNPEARFICRNGLTVDVEVKTPGFMVADTIKEYAIPAVLLDDKGLEFMDYCNEHALCPVMPRINKLKDFLNSAADKFVGVDHEHHMNFLYINWTFSEFPECSYLEAYSLLANQVNGILRNKDLGKEIGLKDEVYDRITAVIVYTESLNGLMFDDFRYIWTRSQEGFVHFGIVGMHNIESLFEVTKMNPINNFEFPALLYISGKENHFIQLMEIINRHAKKSSAVDNT